MNKINLSGARIIVNQDFTMTGNISEGLIVQDWGELKNTFISTFDGLCRLWIWKEDLHVNDVSVSKFQIEE
jgi:hypothetical protein